MIASGRKLSYGSALLAVLLLGGCAGAPVIGTADTAPTYDRTLLQSASSGGNELRVDVEGDPFGAGAVATANATVSAMQGNMMGIPARFSLDPASELTPPTRVVVYYNPRNMRQSESLCAPGGPVAGGRSEDGKLRVVSAWCQTNFQMSSASGHVSDATGLDSAAFKDLVAQMTFAMFPPKDINQKTGDRDACTPPC
ncbi:MAG: hypothetical protein VW644_12530 [Alphaproteobacteria bacterium]|jgi:hypothetical protein